MIVTFERVVLENKDLELPIIFTKFSERWRKCLIILSCTTLFSAIIFYAFPRYDTQAIISFGRITLDGLVLPIGSVEQITEHLSTSGYLQDIQNKSEIPGLAKRLLSKDYGGEGRLMMFNGKSPNSLVLKISEPNKELAEKELNAVTSYLINNDKEKFLAIESSRNKNAIQLNKRYEKLISDLQGLSLAVDASSVIQMETLIDANRNELNKQELERLYPYTYESQMVGNKVFFIENTLYRLLRFLFFGFFSGIGLIIFLFRNK